MSFTGIICSREFQDGWRRLSFISFDLCFSTRPLIGYADIIHLEMFKWPINYFSANSHDTIKHEYLQ